jgi:hypothetical protein
MSIAIFFGADVLIYTPQEFSKKVGKDGFISRVLQEAIEIEGEQKGSGPLVETG